VSLTTRMSAFLLGVLAVVLAGFSTTLYLLARTYLHRQVEERLTTALDTLVAAAEMEPDGIDWEPNVHHLTLGQDGAADQVRWFVRDGEGRVVDRSANLGADDPLTEDSPAWRVLERRLESGPSAVPPKHGALVLTGGVSLEPVRGTLLRLAATLAGLSVGLWLLAALVGRWVARKALAPVTRMAKAARAMTPDDPRQRLPCPGTHDELDDLQRAFNDLLCRLHEALERQRRFTGDASHQLRTPLTAMLGQVEVALRRGRPPEEYREALARVQAQADHLRQIVEALLFLARADAEARLDGLAVADVAEALPTVAARWSGHPRTADLRTEIIGDGPTYLSFDLDAIDPAYAPGVADPEVNGLTMREVVQLLHGFRGVNLMGADIVCYCPPLDNAAQITALTISSMMLELVTLIADFKTREA